MNFLSSQVSGKICCRFNICRYLISATKHWATWSMPGFLYHCTGNSEIGVHVRNNLYYFICIGHLIRSRSATKRILFSPKRPIFLHMRAQLVLSCQLIYLPRSMPLINQYDELSMRLLPSVVLKKQCCGSLTF